MTLMQPVLVDKDGNVAAARQVQSPNQDGRPPGTRITLLVIHGISLPPGEYGGSEIEALFCNTLDCSRHSYFGQLVGLRVSAHFLIRRDGELIQFVSCERRAWHAGHSEWKGRERCNDYSVGIELEGMDNQPYQSTQYQCLAALALGLKARYPIADIKGHADIAPGRKSDPGPAFDWTGFFSLLNS